MPFLRQSTAQTFRFGPFLDATDGVTEEVGLTITPALRRLSKDGGAFGAASGVVNAIHDSDGWYSASLTTTDTDTVGELILNVQVPATHLPVWMRWWVLEEAIYDALYGAAAAGFDATGQVTVGTNNDKTGYGLGNVAHGGVGSVLTLERLIVASTTATEPAVKLTGNTSGSGLQVQGGGSGIGLLARGGSAGASGVWFEAQAGNGHGLNLIGFGAGEGLHATGGITGHGIEAVGGSTSGDGIKGTITSGNEFSGSLSGSVGSIATGGIAALSFAAGAIDTAALAADAITSAEVADSATPRILKNTALANFMFLVVDSTDHFTPKTGLTYVAGDSQRTIDGAAFANTTNLPTEVGFGIYKVSLSAADLNGDVITLKFSKAGSDTRLVTMLTQPT